MRTARGEAAGRGFVRVVAAVACTHLAGCGPRLIDDGAAAADDDQFLADAEQLVDMFCTHNQTCQDWWNENGDTLQYRFFYVFPNTSACYEPLLSGTERIYAGDRCTDPDSMLAFYGCVAAIPCERYLSREELCAAERRALDEALCSPF